MVVCLSVLVVSAPTVVCLTVLVVSAPMVVSLTVLVVSAPIVVCLTVLVSPAPMVVVLLSDVVIASVSMVKSGSVEAMFSVLYSLVCMDTASFVFSISPAI